MLITLQCILDSHDTLTAELVHATTTVHCEASAAAVQILLLLLLSATTAVSADDINATAAHRCILHVLLYYILR